MKKLIYGGLFLAVMAISLNGCKKEYSTVESDAISVLQMEPRLSVSEVQEVINELNSTEKAPPKWWAKIKKWFHDHTGTHLFPNCQGSNPCGPCPGLCLRAGIISGNENDGDVASQENYNNGLRVFGLHLIENRETGAEAIMFVFNEDVNDFTSNSILYIERDLLTNDVIKNALGKESIKFIKGRYNVVYDSKEGYYYAIVDARMN